MTGASTLAELAEKTTAEQTPAPAQPQPEMKRGRGRPPGTGKNQTRVAPPPVDPAREKEIAERRTYLAKTCARVPHFIAKIAARHYYSYEGNAFVLTPEQTSELATYWEETVRILGWDRENGPLATVGLLATVHATIFLDQFEKMRSDLDADARKRQAERRQ